MYPYKIRRRVPFPRIELLTRQKNTNATFLGRRKLFIFLPASIPEINKKNIVIKAERKVAWIGILFTSLTLPTTGKIFVPYGLLSEKKKKFDYNVLITKSDQRQNQHLILVLRPSQSLLFLLSIPFYSDSH